MTGERASVIGTQTAGVGTTAPTASPARRVHDEGDAPGRRPAPRLLRSFGAPIDASLDASGNRGTRPRRGPRGDRDRGHRRDRRRAHVRQGQRVGLGDGSRSRRRGTRATAHRADPRLWMGRRHRGSARAELSRAPGSAAPHDGPRRPRPGPGHPGGKQPYVQSNGSASSTSTSIRRPRRDWGSRRSRPRTARRAPRRPWFGSPWSSRRANRKRARSPCRPGCIAWSRVLPRGRGRPA